MKIEIEIDDIKLFNDAFNNALVAYNDVVYTILFGCDISKKFKPLEQLPENELLARENCLKNFYDKMIEIEKSVKQ